MSLKKEISRFSKGFKKNLSKKGDVSSSKKQSPAFIKHIIKQVKPPKIDKPKTAQQFAMSLFQDIDPVNDIFKINEDTYSLCIEYTDIAFSKASKLSQEDTFLTWVDYLNSFTAKTHIQIVDHSISLKTDEYKRNFLFNEDIQNENIKKIALEFNKLISKNIGDTENTLINKRYIVVSQSAKSLSMAKEAFIDIFAKTEVKFKQLKSKIRIVTAPERLNMIYDLLNIDTSADHDFVNLLEKANLENKTIYDVLVPEDEKAISFRERNYVVIKDQKYLQVLYISKYPKSMTPRFYNAVTSLDMNIITTLNIQPTNNAKIIKKIDKKISGMDTEKYQKVGRLAQKGIRYQDSPDRKLDKKLDDALILEADIRKKKQKVYKNNMLICIIANSLEELENNRQTLQETASENFVELRPILWQQLEGIKNILPLGHNTLQFQRSLTSEATAVNVPFDSKDISQKEGLYYGQNVNTRKCLFADRRALLNGNGSILATSGAGKSFMMKMLMEEIKIKYPNDDIIIIDPQKEYDDVINANQGQKITISMNSNTYINPFDLDENYGISDNEQPDPVKEKIEYVISFIDSLTKDQLTGEEESIIDRCCKIIYEPFIESSFRDESLIPNLPKFYECLKKQPEEEAEKLALILERYVNGSIDMFAKKTNVNINNKFICFDISNLQKSMQSTGYLVVLDHIMVRLARNKAEGRFTWIFIDEFHILLKNAYSADYVSKIYKIGRKFHAIPTICTQNISEVLKSDYGCDILNNSEFAIILKQKPLDLRVLSQIFNISEEEQQFIANAPAGNGLMIYGEDCYQFKNTVPEDYYIYQLNETSSLQKSRT